MFDAEKIILGSLFCKPFHHYRCLNLNFTDGNKDLISDKLIDTQEFTRYIFSKIAAAGAEIGIGGYLEDRIIYKRSTHFDSKDESRSIHLGVDIWIEAETEIFAPIDGTIYGFQNNNNYGDYGPTIVLEHLVEGMKFYTLYGHLSLKSLANLHEKKLVKKGETIGKIGNHHENGDWPPHLHFQIITDMLGNKGDFPGVCKPSEQDFYKAICPNPMLLIR